MGDIFTYLVNMPSGIWGHCNPNPDGSYTIFINSRLSYETQRKVYLHEIYHIVNGDFDRPDSDVDKIEYRAHMEGYI